MGNLTHSSRLSVEDNSDESDDDETEEVIYLATMLHTVTRPSYREMLSAYDEEQDYVELLDDHFSIDIRCYYSELNLDVLKEQGNNDDTDIDCYYSDLHINLLKDKIEEEEEEEIEEEEEEEEEEEDDDDTDPYRDDIKKPLEKSFKRPIQGFPTNYEQAWHVVYKWLEEELDMVSESYVLPLLTEELVHWVLRFLSEIPNGRKKLGIEIVGQIRELLLFRSPDVATWFVTEVAVWEKTEKKEEADEEFVINVYSEYRPVGNEGSVCKVHKCSHPTHELRGLGMILVADIVSIMLKQVDLPGEVPLQCLVNEIIDRANSLIIGLLDDKRKTLELDAVIRITEVSFPKPPKEDDTQFSRLSVHPNLLLKPLLSCHFLDGIC